MILNKILTFLIFTFLILSAGCSVISDSNDGTDTTIQIDRDVYHAELTSINSNFRPVYEFEIVARYQNLTGQIIYFESCSENANRPFGGLNLLTPGEKTQSAYSGICAGFGFIGIEPGETRVDTVQISGPSTWKFGTNEPFGAVEGGYHLEYPLAHTCLNDEGTFIGNDCQTSESEVPASKEFEVKLAESETLETKTLIQTDSDSYTAVPMGTDRQSNPLVGIELSARFVNTTDKTIYLSQCGDLPPRHGASFAGETDSVYEQSAYAMGPLPTDNCEYRTLSLEPGEERVDEIVIQGPNTIPTGSSEHLGELDGLFHLKYVAGLCFETDEKGNPEVGCLLPVKNLPRSNTFEIKLEEGAIR